MLFLVSKRLTIIFCVLILSFASFAQDDIYELPFIDWYECPFEIPEGETEGETLDCGYLVTYEDHFSDDDDAVVELAFVILYSTNDPHPSPVIYLDGGPGSSPLSYVEDWTESSIREDYDIILIDQRGTGFSYPSLNCVEIEYDESDDPLEAEQACFDRLAEEGINLNAYNSLQSSSDLADFMALLGEEMEYEGFNLLGISYGTRLALTIMREYPDEIRSVIIDSVYPPNVNAYEQQALNNYYGLQMLFDGCFADADCDNAYPNLEDVFYDVYVSLNDSPALYEIEDDETGEIFEEELTGDSLLDLLVESLYSTTAIPELPLVIYEVSEGNYEIVAWIDTETIAEDYGRQRQSFEDDFEDISDSEAMFNTVECIEELPFNSFDEAVAVSMAIPEIIRDYLLSSVENQFTICEIYGLEPADDIETEAVYSDIPTLVLTGDYDPITPPSDAQIAAETLSNSYYFEFPGHGHGIVDTGDCANSIIAQFLEDPDNEPDGSCLADMTGPDFVIR